MAQSIGNVALLVHDYDEAIDWFIRVMHFSVLQDLPQGEDKRWVLLGTDGGGTRLLLARAVTPEQRALVGNQAGGRVFLFLDTDDFERDYTRMKAEGAHFLEQPRREPYGTVAVFEDLYGNKWDLLQLNPA